METSNSVCIFTDKQFRYLEMENTEETTPELNFLWAIENDLNKFPVALFLVGLRKF